MALTAVITLYSCVAIEFFWCYIRDIPFSSKPKANSGSQVTLNSYRGEMTTPISVMVAALIFNLLCLFIRCAMFVSILLIIMLTTL